MSDPFATQMNRLEQAVLFEPGRLSPQVRQAAATDGSVPEVLRTYVDKIIKYAYRVTDEDVQLLLEAGYSQDQIFELTVSAALGAGMTRLKRGLELLEESENDATEHR
jgi:alkylhydroperoxidase/carboxymuconolactone decarboxylase family protein YurZ